MILSPVVGLRVKVVAACCLCALCACVGPIFVLRDPALVQASRLVVYLGIAGLTIQVFAYGKTIGYAWNVGSLSARVSNVLRCSVMSAILAFGSIWVGAILFAAVIPVLKG